MAKTRRQQTLRPWIACALIALAVVHPAMAILPSPDGDLDDGSGIDADTAREDFDVREQVSPKAASSESLKRVAWRDGLERSLLALQRDGRPVRIEHNPLLGTVEVIAPAEGRRTLSSPGATRTDTLQTFLHAYPGLHGLDSTQLDALEVDADYVNPNGRMAWVRLTQRVDGVPVFGGEINAGFSADGSLVRVLSNVVPGIEAGSLAAPGDPAAAVLAATAAIDRPRMPGDLLRLHGSDDGLSQTFDRAGFANPIVAEAMVFPLAPGQARMAWRVLLWESDAAWYVIVDAVDGQLLWRRNLVRQQTQAATYGVYSGSSPAPYVASAPDGSQGSPVSRVNRTLVGNEFPRAFNNLGWITDGGLTTSGNNVEAGIDRDGVNGVDAGGAAFSASRTFAFTYNPSPGNPAPGDEPLLAASQNGAVANAFYWANLVHDATYLLGFTEPARNYQQDNFGRGGVAGDRLSVEVQDNAGTNNANFAIGADGVRGRLQLYLWTAPTPDRDGALDRTVMVHELAHGLSGRLVGNGAGLAGPYGGGIAEGWSEFIALTLFATAAEPVTGLYPVGSYSSHLLGGLVDNTYYGIRRFPYAILSVTGGPQNRPHAPQTFADIDGSQVDLSDGAYPPRPGSATTIHARGEVWALLLLEARADLIARLGYDAGSWRMLQFVVDGMKLTPLNPDFIQARDAILAAATADGTPEDLFDLWNGFARRGLGSSASSTSTGVIEAFDTPFLQQSPAFTLSDAQCNANGIAEPGERLQLNIPLTNASTSVVTAATLAVNGGAPVAYGTIAAGATVSRDALVQVPEDLPCGDLLPLTFTTDSSLGEITFERALETGLQVVGAAEDFDDVVVPALPGNWTSSASGAVMPWVSTATDPDSAPNAAFVANPSTTGEASLVSPEVTVLNSNARVRFRHRYATETGFDGGVLEIAIGGGAYQDIVSAGGNFVSGAYNGTLGSSGCAVNPNPLAARAAFTGSSVGYISSEVRLPAGAVGQTIRLRWRMGADCSIGSTGWWVDDIELVTNVTCAAAECTTLIHRDGFEP